MPTINEKKDNQKTSAFLKVADQFQLGELVTEKPHPKTVGLRDLTHRNLTEAIETFAAVDSEMLNVLVEKTQLVQKLSREIVSTLGLGGRVFLSGCGATGRLSLVLENIWRQQKSGKDRDLVVGFMAGGDLALIHSIEKFEDFADYGARQLQELGFSSKDLLVASSEGGETPWVIGTALKAAELGGRSFFLYCNPDELLVSKLKRCQEVFSDHRVEKLNFTASSQALTGSTRLQASSILMAAIGTALFQKESQKEIGKYLSSLKEFYEGLDKSKMAELIRAEADIYQKRGDIYYAPSLNVAMSALTDTTERSPTFSLSGFNNKTDTESPRSWCYLLFENSETSEEAWKKLLFRAPRPLRWSEVQESAGAQRLYGFDFSKNVLNWRGPSDPSVFQITYKDDALLLALGESSLTYNMGKCDLLGVHLTLKMLLNMHSTLLMGLMNRYQSNIMTFVRPSNNKLIDRCVRYAQLLLREKGVEVDYKDLVNDCFNFMDESSQSEPVVMKIVGKYA